MSDTETQQQNVLDEQLHCEYCRSEVDGGIINPDSIAISITKLNTLSGTQYQETIHICTQHIPDPIHPQEGPFHFVFDTAQYRITGGTEWFEGEYPYHRDLPPKKFSDRILGLAMVVQQAINGRGDY